MQQVDDNYIRLQQYMSSNESNYYTHKILFGKVDI
jgi:hypothetical protein